MEIREIFDEKEKTSISEKVLNALPNWFGIPEATLDYIEGVKDKPFYAVFSDNKAVGFVSILVHSPYTAEIYVMGILETHHRMGIGRQIVNTCEEYCCKNGMEFLTVKTLDEKNPDEYYRKTRLFYESLGFKKIEVFPLLWDECNPCLFLAKYVG
ncbi:MAG: GNAT family N-acetyltransferase [Oscillospiraceae bacterium]|nr:GNAT family N-acetyltransferase [Oscillospiraceae bacterium]